MTVATIETPCAIQILENTLKRYEQKVKQNDNSDFYKKLVVVTKQQITGLRKLHGYEDNKQT